MKKMTVDIWSDIRCPFCYIGKRNFEKGLAEFNAAQNIDVRWHSFQLDPSLKTDSTRTPLANFTEAKGVTEQQAREMFSHVINVAKAAGLQFDMEKQKVANSFRAHLLIQLAQQHSLGNEAEEALFKAFFTEGKNIDDTETLVALGKSISLDETEVRKALESEDLAYLVSQDMQQAAQMGISGVPFFVFNDKYGVSGAQPAEVFTEVLEKSWEEFSGGDQGLKIINSGDSCDVNGTCD